ncbi:unnamed protein product [Moneuplotes crassus]|uniref:Prefoldin subunit n=1 Tax=Euplotes crassus TaxID=5936 RepID=A0AAD1XPC0_EUPCR|nr:unnamed protein product [Moneuplotes crassus]
MDKSKLDIYSDIKSKTVNEATTALRDIDTKIDAYNKLSDDMDELRQRSYVETMVPINKVAFFKGHLKHQNEILVFLGNNYFVERTVDECKPIIQRRIDLLQSDRKEFAQVAEEESQKSSTANQLLKEEQKDDATNRWNDDGTLEIRESIEPSQVEETKEQQAEEVTEDLEEIDLTEEQLEAKREQEYKQMVQTNPELQRRKKALEEKMKQMGMFFSKEDPEGPVEQEEQEEDKIQEPISEKQPEEVTEPKKNALANDSVFGAIMERNIDEVPANTSSQVQDGDSQPKKMSKFKQRQLRNKR